MRVRVKESKNKETMETSAEHNSMCNKNCSTDDMDVLKSTTDTKLNVKYEHVGDDKCVNKICTNNRKNSKIIRDDTACNVVIDNNDNANDNNQAKQLQQQKQQPSQMKQPPFELSPLTPSSPSPSPSPPQQQPSTYGCKHYKRKAKFVVSNT